MTIQTKIRARYASGCWVRRARFCGQGSGYWCVDAGGREIRNIFRQHDRRYQKAATTPAELRALLTKQRLI